MYLNSFANYKPLGVVPFDDEVCFAGWFESTGLSQTKHVFSRGRLVILC